MTEIMQFSSSLLNVVSGGSVQRKAAKSGTGMSHPRYERRHVTDRRRPAACHAGQYISQSPGSLRPVCAPCPLENLPLTGQRMIIGRKDGFGEVWRPAAATPKKMSLTFLHECPTLNIPTSCARFQQKPWCELIELPVPRPPLPSLDESLEFNEGKQNCSKAAQKCSKFLPPLSRKQKETGTFYPEPELEHTIFHPNKSITGTGSMYSVSAHKPVKARNRSEAPFLSFFHFFQTEIVPNEIKADTNDNESENDKMNENIQNIKEKLLEDSQKNSQFNDAIYSNMGTLSTLSPRKSQCTADTSQELLSENGGLSFRAEVHDDLKIEHERIDNSHRAKTNTARSYSGSILGESSDLHEKGCAFTDDNVPIKLKDITEISSNKQIKWEVLEIDSNDFKEGCAFYEANLLMKSGRVRTKVKMSQDATFTCSSMSKHFKLEKRRIAMEKLTKLPLRLLRNSQKMLYTPNSALTGEREKTSNRLGTISGSGKSATLSTINLQLDTVTKQRGTPIPVYHSNRLIFTTQPIISSHKVRIKSSPRFGDPYTLLDNAESLCPFLKCRNITKHSSIERKQCYRKLQDFAGFEGFCIHGSSPRFFLGENSAFENVLEQMKVQDDGNAQQLFCLAPSECSSSSDINMTNGMEDEQPVNESHNKLIDPVATDLNTLREEHASHSDDQLNEINDQTDHFSSQTCLAQQTFENATYDKIHKDCNNKHECALIPASCDVAKGRKAYSVMSSDDVPNNSPTDSPYTHAAARAHAKKCGRKFGNYTERVSRKNNDLYENNDHLTIFADSCIQITQDGSDADQENLTLDHEEINTVQIEKRQSCCDHVIEETLDCAEMHEKEEERVATASSHVPTPLSIESAFSDTGESDCSGKQFITEEFNFGFNERLKNNTPDMDFCADDDISKQKRLLKLSGSHIVDYEDILWEKYSCCEHSHYELNNIEEYKSSEDPEQPNHPCKNVRFSDVNKVISFRNDDIVYDDDVSPLVAYVPRQNSIQPTQGGLKLHKLTLQPPTCPPVCRCNRAAKKLDFINPLIRFGQISSGPVKSNHLELVKWSACPYKTQETEIGGMCVRGRKMTSSQNGVSRDSEVVASSAVGEGSVLYTICPNCEVELHKEFGNDCSCQETSFVIDNINLTDEFPQQGEGKEECEKKAVPVMKVSAQQQSAPRCRHKEKGCCHGCSKVLKWVATSATENCCK